MGSSCSFRNNLDSFRTFRRPLFPKPVFWLRLFLLLSRFFMFDSRSWMISHSILFIKYPCFINDFDDFLIIFSRFFMIFQDFSWFSRFFLHFFSPFYRDLVMNSTYYYNCFHIVHFQQRQQVYYLLDRLHAQAVENPKALF